MNEAQALEALAQALAEKVRRGKPAKPKLRLVTPARPSMFDSITRDSILRRVRYLARGYSLQWLVEQTTFNVPNVECLEDAALSELLRTLERARECIADGISLEDAGLVKNLADQLPLD